MDQASKSKYSTTVVSKATFVVCLMVPAAAIFSLSFLTAEERILAVCLTVITTTVYSAVPVALRLVLIELAPKYTAILMGILTTVGCIPGMIAPLVTSIITHEGTAQSWAEIFYMCSGMYAGAALIFLCFGNSKEQSWSD
ncbi:sialin-like [Liolophura sinensis]|uniref:sialin-like n=1 Tax=Liolophura sinensis TaxID=3198878 RepID=UPI003158AAE4